MSPRSKKMLLKKIKGTMFDPSDNNGTDNGQQINKSGTFKLG